LADSSAIVVLEEGTECEELTMETCIDCEESTWKPLKMLQELGIERKEEQNPKQKRFALIPCKQTIWNIID